MMKKISKLALLAAATVFLLAAFPACSDDDGDGNTTVQPGGGDTGDDDEKGGSDVDPGTSTTPAVYVLEATALDTVATGDKTDGSTTTVGTSDYFTIYWSANMRVDPSTKSWDDGYSSTQRINMAGKWTGSKQFIKFTTKKAVTVKVWWAEGDVNRPLQIGKYTGSTPTDIVAEDTTSTAKNDPHLSTLTLSEAGDWALGSGVGANYIYKIEVTE